MAVEEWLALRSSSEETSSSTSSQSSTSFERPLAALDLFILEQRPEGDIEDVSSASPCHSSRPSILSSPIDALLLSYSF